MRIVLIIFLIFSLIPLGCGRSITGVEKTKNFMHQLQYKREKTLVVSNQNGSIAIQAQEGADIATVTATIAAVALTDTAAQEFLDKIDVRFAKEGDELSVETIYPKAWTMPAKAKKPSSWKVDYTIIIPDSLDVNCTNANGDVKVVGANEKVDIQNMNGEILVKDNRQETTAIAVNGNIQISNDQDYNTSVRATTQNGSLSIDMPKVQMGIFAIRTLSGNIKMSLPSGHEPEIDLNTVNGNIELFLGERLSGKVELSTTNGKVSTDMVVNTTTGVGGILEKKVIKGVVGAGFGNVKAVTKNGDVTMNYGEAPTQST